MIENTDKVAQNGCACAGWAWGSGHLKKGAVRAHEGRMHHPACRCPGDVVGCRGGSLFQPCPRHGASERY